MCLAKAKEKWRNNASHSYDTNERPYARKVRMQRHINSNNVVESINSISIVFLIVRLISIMNVLMLSIHIDRKGYLRHKLIYEQDWASFRGESFTLITSFGYLWQQNDVIQNYLDLIKISILYWQKSFRKNVIFSITAS